MKPRIVLSGVNLVEGGTLSVFQEALAALSAGYLHRFDVTALVHKRDLFDAGGISYLEFPEIKSSWLRRLQFEYVHCRTLSRELQPVLWLAMHDMTPTVCAPVRAVYCHNPSPFYRLPLREAPLSPTFTLFRFLYGYLYSINIRRNSFVVVQQDWLRNEFKRRFHVKNVVVAHPSVLPMPAAPATQSAGRDERFTFFYPALPRPFKNFELLLNAAQMLEQQGTADFTLALTVDGSENRYSAQLRKEFAGLKSVRWLGRQSREQVETLYSESDCLLFPSKLETWGMPITEWKRTQKPMLVANLPYSRETVGDYPNVGFIDVSDTSALAEKMRGLIRGNTDLGTASSPTIAAPFARNWAELFDILLEGEHVKSGFDSGTTSAGKLASEDGCRVLPLSVSLVVYRTPAAELLPLFETLMSSDLVEWTVVDNGSTEDPTRAQELRDTVEDHNGSYIAAPGNLGFGAGHNLALASQLEPKAEFHLMVNPDIAMQAETLKRLIAEMKARPEVGLIMPKVLYEDGSFQPVCKLSPTPMDFALRRFAPAFVKRMFGERLAQYEMTGLEDRECDKVPFLSGCFLFTRRAVLDAVQGFDDRFFLYLEDVDLCRRMAQHSTLLYWPRVSVTHGCFRGAYRSRKLMLLFLQSAVAYFNKWGWFFDRQRREANRAALDCLR